MGRATWAASSETVPSNKRKMRRFRFCACANYLSGHTFLYLMVLVSIQWRPGSDCADLMADLGIRCPHMPENTFSYVEPKYSSLRSIFRRRRPWFTWLSTQSDQGLGCPLLKSLYWQTSSRASHKTRRISKLSKSILCCSHSSRRNIITLHTWNKANVPSLFAVARINSETKFYQTIRIAVIVTDWYSNRMQ